MTALTKIEWTSLTWNPVTGCSKVSPGCANCYALQFGGPAHSLQTPAPGNASLTTEGYVE